MMRRHNPLTAVRRFLMRYPTQIVAVSFWLTMIALMFNFMRQNDLSVLGMFDVLEDTMRDNWYGAVLFLVVFVLVRPFTLIPVIVFMALGGRIFGLELGFIYGLIGTTLTAALPYGFGRLFTRSPKGTTNITLPGIQRIGRRIEAFLRRNAFYSLLAMRLVNVPFDIVSLISGYMALPFRVFLLATFLGNISNVYGFVALGASIEGDLASGDYRINLELVGSSLVVLIVGALISVGLRRWLARRRRANGQGDANNSSTVTRNAPPAK